MAKLFFLGGYTPEPPHEAQPNPEPQQGYITSIQYLHDQLPHINNMPPRETG